MDMTWRVTCRYRSNAPDGQRHLPPETKTLDLADLHELAEAMADVDPAEVVYLMAMPIGGLLHQWREAGGSP